jgi:CcmD family protein
LTWMIAAYMTIWIAIFFYVFSLDRKQRVMTRELDQLKNKLNG